MVMNKDEFIFGTRAVMEAIKTNRHIEKIFIKKGLKNELSQELFQLIKEEQIPFQFVPLEKINRITRKNHQGVLALLSPIEYHNIETLLPGIYESGKDPFILILDQITDVRNLGAIIRSAECAGVNAVIIPEKGIARIGGDAVKTSAGAIHHISICKVPSLAKTIGFLKNSGIKIIAATEKAQTLYSDSELNGPVAIVMGSEETGISNSVLQLTDEQLMIPVMGRIQSLNVSVAAAIILYEVVRQRN
jgi:23S rRNA (guanosine2251-2'-O)-methyltransferase